MQGSAAFDQALRERGFGPYRTVEPPIEDTTDDQKHDEIDQISTKDETTTDGETADA